MNSKFIFPTTFEYEQLDWGQQRWLSLPKNTGAQSLTIAEVELLPGVGHNFHKHPNQEELIYVLSGRVEHWNEQEKQILETGDAVFIGADVVHATFNISKNPARVLAILGPSIGEAGYEVVEVFHQEPWNSLRA